MIMLCSIVDVADYEQVIVFILCAFSWFIGAGWSWNYNIRDNIVYMCGCVYLCVH